MNKIKINKNKNRINWQKVFETEWFSLEATSDKFSGDQPYYRLFCKEDSAEILAVTDKQKIILVRQFRPAVGIHTLEFPAGYVGKNESSKTAIKRELEEETGFVCDSIVCIGTLKVFPSRVSSTNHIFFGKGAKIKTKKNIKNRETDIEVVLIAPDEFEKLIIEGKFVAQEGLGVYLLAKLKGFL